MKGKILGYDKATKEGVIVGEDNKRYSFDLREWKEEFLPTKETTVDFNPTGEGNAEAIFAIKDKEKENDTTLMGLISLALTFFLGFIGTFISRVVISGQSAAKALIPTLIHFVLSFSIIIPVIGWLVYLVITIYYMIQNYRLVVNKMESSH